MDPKCNPMKETVPNSFDSFQLAMDIADFDANPNYINDKEQGFQYTGLIPQQTYTIQDKVDEAPDRFVSFHDMQSRFLSSAFGSGPGGIDISL